VGRHLGVDIVITNHNYGRFLAAAIDSALAQTRPGVRVIAVDDGSDDGSREILAGYEDRIEVILKERGGQASALNAGIARCQGEVLVVLDADDVLRPEAADLVAKAFEADADLVKVQFRMAVIDREGRLKFDAATRRQRAIADLRVGDRIIGSEKRGAYRHYVTTEVMAHWSTVKAAHRVTLADSTELVTSGDHRFLTVFAAINDRDVASDDFSAHDVNSSDWCDCVSRCRGRVIGRACR